MLGLGAHVRGVLVAGQWCVQRDGQLRLRQRHAPLRDQLCVGHGGDVVRFVVLSVRGSDGRERDVLRRRLRSVVPERYDPLRRRVHRAHHHSQLRRVRSGV